MADLLLDSKTATGNGEWKARQAGVFTFAVDGTWGNSTVTLEMKGPKGSGIPIPGVSLTANGVVNVEIPGGSYRAVVTGGAAMNLSAALTKAGNG